MVERPGQACAKAAGSHVTAAVEEGSTRLNLGHLGAQRRREGDVGRHVGGAHGLHVEVDAVVAVGRHEGGDVVHEGPDVRGAHGALEAGLAARAADGEQDLLACRVDGRDDRRDVRRAQAVDRGVERCRPGVGHHREMDQRVEGAHVHARDGQVRSAPSPRSTRRPREAARAPAASAGSRTPASSAALRIRVRKDFMIIDLSSGSFRSGSGDRLGAFPGCCSRRGREARMKA